MVQVNRAKVKRSYWRLALLLLAVMAVCLVASLPCGGLRLARDDWERVTSAASFSSRDSAEGVVFKGFMWLSNGYRYEGEQIRDLWRSTDGSDWECILSETPYDPYSELVVYQDRLWAVNATVWVTDDGFSWEYVGQTPFGQIRYGEAVVFQGKVWQLGASREVWSTTDMRCWEADAAPYGERFAAGVAVFQDCLWVLGGAMNAPSDPPEVTYPESSTLNDIWRFDGQCWRFMGDGPWCPRRWFVATEFDGRLLVMGGLNSKKGRNLRDSWYCDGENWTKMADNAWSARHEPTCLKFDGALYLMCGNENPVVESFIVPQIFRKKHTLKNDVWRLSCASST